MTDWPTGTGWEVTFAWGAQTVTNYWGPCCWISRDPVGATTVHEVVRGPLLAPPDAICANCGRVLHEPPGNRCYVCGDVIADDQPG